MRQLRWSWFVTVSYIVGLCACTFDVPQELDNTPPAQDLSAPRDQDRLDLSSVSPDLQPSRDMPRDTGMAPDLLDPDLAMEPDLAMMPDLMVADMPPEDMARDQGSGPIFLICNGQRVDIASDVNHCGGCDISCEQGRGTCENKMCACTLSGAMACGEDGRCVDVVYDPRNCGACGKTCGVGAVCDMGACVCRPGLTACGDRCVDLQVDPLNCGGCDTDCGRNNRCKAGECGNSNVCGLGYTFCRRDGRTACVNDNVDQESDLSCRPGKNLDFFCGDVCEGDEVCFEPNDFVNPIQCRPYRPARACTQCPCSECRSDEECRRQILGVQDVTYCVRKP